MIAIGQDVGSKSYLRIGARGPKFSVYVSAARPINVYIVDDDSRRLYEAGQQFRHFGPGTVRHLVSEVQASGGPWFVIIENPDPIPVHVTHNVV